MMLLKLFKAANKYREKGISVIATDGHKKSIFGWKEFQERIMTEEEIREQLSHGKAEGIAIVCGSVSGGLELIDVDLKYALRSDFFEDFKNRIREASEELWDKLLVAETRGKGYHLYYRCEEIQGNQKLAMRHPTEEEKKASPTMKFVTLIETRGEAGYAIAPPTEGYRFVEGKGIQVISIDEREILLEAARSLNEYYEEKKVEIHHRPEPKQFGLSPFDDYNKRGDVIGLLEKHGWKRGVQKGEKIYFKRPGDSMSKTSGDFHVGKNWFAVFTTNSCFEPQKAYLPYAVFAMLECNGDYKLAAKRLLEEGYGEKRQSFGGRLEKEVFKRRQDGMDKEGLVTYLVKQEKKSVEEAEQILGHLEAQWGEKLCVFWDVDMNGKVLINRYRLERFLSDVGGFYLYFYDTSNLYRFVQERDGLVEEASTEQVKKFIKDYVNGLPDTFDGGVTPHELLEVLYKGADTYFSKAYLEFIDRKKFDFLKDTSEVAYFPFKNGVVVVEKGKSPVLKTYGDIGKVIWKDQVTDFNIMVDDTFDADLCEYARFIHAISGREEERFHYAISLIGYMLHGWKDPARPFAPILAEETDDEKKGGGTGKGIFIKAISHLVPTVRIDGKNFKIDKTFAFQRVTLGTRLVVIEDCPKNVDFERYYPTITEGITIERKNKDELFLPYQDSPKISFTTNYSISNNAEHARRRQKVFEFAAHYNSRYTPQDEFGHKLFDDWDADEWNRFYNFMFMCVGVYLDGGIKEIMNSEKLIRKHIKLNYTEEFLEYLEGVMENGFTEWHIFNSEYQSFLKVNDWDKKDYSNKRFKKALQEACDSFGWRFETQRNWQNAGQHEFKIVKTQKKIEQ